MPWEPHVRKHATKRRTWFTFTIGGKDHYLGTDRAEAYKKAAALMVEAGGTPGTPETVQGLVVAYEKRHGTLPRGATLWGQFCGTRRLVELRAGDLQPFSDHLQKNVKHARTDKPLAAWSIRHYVTDARVVWCWGVEQGYLEARPDAAKMPIPVDIPRDVPPTTVKAVSKKLNARARALVTFIASTGCRPSEARLLEWSAVDLANGVLNLERHKTTRKGKSRTIYLTPKALGILKKIEPEGKYVFLSRYGRPYTRAGLRTVLRTAGLSRTYALRHTFAQWYLDHGGEDGGPGRPEELQELLGHSDGRMVGKYAQVRSVRLRQIASRLKGPLGAG